MTSRRPVSHVQTEDSAVPDQHGAADHQGAIRRALPIYYALLFAILTVFVIYLLIELKHVLMLLFISLLFAAATARPAALLQRFHIPQGIAVALIYLFSLSLVFAVAWFVVPPVLGQVANLGDEFPSYIERFQGFQERYDELRQEYPSLDSFDDQVAQIGGRIISAFGQRLTALPSQLFGLFLDLLSVFVISMLLVTNRHRLLETALELVHPDHRDETRDIAVKMWQRIGHYLRAKIIVMVIVGTITYFTLLLIGVPFALLLAIIVAFGEAIPRAGPWLARIPLIAISALEGWVTLGLTFGASVVIENAKGYVISPVVEGHQLDIHPLLVFISVLVGGALLGVAGAFVAVPAAAMVQVLFEDVIRPWRLRQLGTEPVTQAASRPPVSPEGS